MAVPTSPLATRRPPAPRYGAPDATPGVRGIAVAVVDTEYEVSFPVLLPFAFATSQVPILAELRSTTERSTFPDGARVGVDPRRQLLSKAIALRIESEAQAACLRRAGDVQAEPCGVVAVLASPNLITVHPRCCSAWKTNETLESSINGGPLSTE